MHCGGQHLVMRAWYKHLLLQLCCSEKYLVNSTRICRDWLEAQEVKKNAAAAMAEEDAPKKKKKPRKPTIQFKQGATAQESVERMFESKNLKSRVNTEMLKQFFECVLSADICRCVS